MNATVAAAPATSHEEVVRVLQNSLYPGAKRESVELVLSYCRVNGIDPMLKPVHIVPTNVKVAPDKWETRDVLMPAISDYRIKAARSGQYGGKSEPVFGPDKTETIGGVRVTFPEWCRVTVSRIVQGQPREFTAVERWRENFAAVRKTGAPNEMWQKRAYGQLAKCAEAQALRMAFPEFSGGQPTAEEMEGKEIFTGPTVEHEPEPKSSRREEINQAHPLMPAGPVDPRPVDITEPPKLEKRSWKQWAESLELAVADAKSTEELGKLLARAEVTEIKRLAEEGQKSEAKNRILIAIAEAEARYLADPPVPPEEELPEVEIMGEANVAAG